MVDAVSDAAAAAAVAAAKPWYDGQADAAMVGHWQNKGYDVTNPAKIAIEASKAYQEAEKLIGAPASQMIRLPVDWEKNSDAMKPIWQRLGAPNEAKDYDFPALKDKDGKITNTALDGTLRESLFQLNVPKAMASAIAAIVAKRDVDVATTSATETAAAQKTEAESLQKNWGTNAPRNMVIAKNAAAALRVTAEEVAALEKVVGYARTMEMFREIGAKIGEDKFIRTDGPSGSNIATKEQAQARITELKNDKAFTKRYLDGDVQAVREMGDLHKLLAGDDVEGRF